MKGLQYFFLASLAFVSLSATAQRTEPGKEEYTDVDDWTAQAQRRKSQKKSHEGPTNAGAWVLGINLIQSGAGFGSDGDAFYNISVAPRAGYFIIDNLQIGGMLTANHAATKSYHAESYGAGGFARYYFGKEWLKSKSMRKVRFFVEGGTGIQGGSARFTNTDGTEETVNFRSMNPYVLPGLNYFLRKNIALDGGLYLSHTIYSHDGARNMTDENKIGLNAGLHFFFLN